MDERAALFNSKSISLIRMRDRSATATRNRTQGTADGEVRAVEGSPFGGKE